MLPRSSLTTAVTIAAALLAVALPIGLAIHLSARQAEAAETQRVASWANAVLDRAEAGAIEVGTAVRELSAAHATDPCSPASIGLMRRHALGSQYLKALGHVVGTRLVCSSLGGGDEVLELGPVEPEWMSPGGARLRPNVRFPFDEDDDYLVVEEEGFVAVVARDLPIDGALRHGGTEDEQDASLAIFSTFNGQLLESRGNVNLTWLAASNGLPGERSTVTFIEDGHVVAVAVSHSRYLGAMAALPVRHIAAHARSTALVLLPAGALAGLLLAAVMFRWRRQQTAMPAILRLALKRREFSLMYQPVVDLQTGRWTGAEALLRWRRPDGEMVPPDLFIPAAENTGMIRELTSRVFELAARDLANVARRAPDLHFALNLSAHDLQTPGSTLAAMHRLAARTGLAPGNFTVEITERGLLQSAETRPVLDELRAAGFAVAIDDFGTGYSNLAHLANFKLDYLKIDKLFVDTMRGDTATSSVVPHIVEMARTLDLKVIAEGVETEEQAQYLRELGVHYAQGWLFGKPMKARELLLGYLRSTAAVRLADRSAAAPVQGMRQA